MYRFPASQDSSRIRSLPRSQEGAERLQGRSEQPEEDLLYRWLVTFAM